jgi:hypothetical protein
VDDAGTCPVCVRTVRLTPARRLIKTHVTNGERCAGTGRAPVTAVAPASEPPPEAPPADAAASAARLIGAWLSRHRLQVAVGLVVAAALVISALVDGASSAGPADRAVASSSAAASTSPVGGRQGNVNYTPAPPVGAPVPVVSSDAGPYGLPQSTVESVFLSAVHDAGLGDAGSDAAALAHARRICQAFDGGARFEDLTEAIVSGGATYVEAGSFIGLATAAFCPDHTPGSW